jgi:transcriptional regulator with GAF, ATPase, and Fis domain
MPRAAPDESTADAPDRRDGEVLWLVISSASGVESMPLPKRDRILVGRAADCDVVIDDDSVSRHHAAIRDRVVEDLGSRNGTTVKGRRLVRGDSAGLEIGTIIEVGSATILLYRGPPPDRALAEPVSGPEGPILVEPTMRRLYAMLDVVAPSALPVLVLGETGTGKEVFASEIHSRSARKAARFLRLNCAALSGSLLESELFGHERGAFTGAAQAKPGLFEAADGGTVFLDEVGELPLDTQAKLLRVLENGEVIRLGSVKPRRVDVRWVSATNRDLVALAQAGLFRSDLYFRLNGVAVTLPPLRRRQLEILPFAQHFADRFSKSRGHASPRFAEAAKDALLRYAWPGNVRELKSVVERAIVLAAGAAVVDADHLQLPTGGEAAESAERAARRKDPFDKERVLEALQRSHGNQTEAARLLGVSRRTLINKLEKYGLERPRKRS